MAVIKIPEDWEQCSGISNFLIHIRVVRTFFNRPLAKLSKAVKVADTSDQGKAESKALSRVTVTLGEDTKPFDKTDGVFNKDTFS